MGRHCDASSSRSWQLPHAGQWMAWQRRGHTMTGLIVTWIPRKGVGFIRPDGSDDEIFLHISDLPNRKPFPVNTRVQFGLGVYGGRKKAINLTAMEGAL